MSEEMKPEVLEVVSEAADVAQEEPKAAAEAVQETVETVEETVENAVDEEGNAEKPLVEEVKEIVAGLKKEYHDARHHCYAYRLGYKGDRFRANDDGEPSGSAGRPILGQIDSLGLSDILVVVVRYFGGIKLGIPGLIRAYKTSTADALAQAEIVDKVAGKTFRVTFDYLSMNGVMKVLKEMGLNPTAQDFGMECALDVRVRLALEEDFRKRMADIAKLEEK